MKIQQTLLTKNPCVLAGETITPQGIMIHSTATPGVMAADWFSRWNKSVVNVAVHAFVDDSDICQHLPWTMRAWHAAGKANNTHIAMELCEPTDYKTNQEYFKACYANAVELCVHLCQTYQLTPSQIISHQEGYQRGLASNHGDPQHWWRFFGVTMDTFRSDVKKVLAGNPIQVEVYTARPVLQSGDTGSDVVYLQGQLNLAKTQLGLSFQKLKTDGIFGAKTLWAVKEFQVARGLTVDGVVGKNTWKALEIRFGDVNGDGHVNAKDALSVLRYGVKKESFTAGQKEAADMNGDGQIDAKDAKSILQRAVS